MATDPAPDLLLHAVGSEPRAIRTWLTNFHLCLVVIDPFTNESAWILDTAGRVLCEYKQSNARVGWLVTGTPAEAAQFLGPWAQELLVFTDPDRALVKGLGLGQLPALVHLNMSGAVEGAAEGWHPIEWRAVAENLSRILAWNVPVIPTAGDPPAFPGTPAAA